MIENSQPASRGEEKRERQFAALFDAHRHAVLGFAIRRVDQREDAADILSETFLVAWRRLDQVPAGDLTRAWLFGVARNVLRNHHRGLRRSEVLSSKLKEELSTSEPAELLGESIDPEVLAALQTLSEDDQELLTLSAWDDLSPNEIATVLEINRASARSRLHRARRRLRAALVATEGNRLPGKEDQ